MDKKRYANVLEWSTGSGLGEYIKIFPSGKIVNKFTSFSDKIKDKFRPLTQKWNEAFVLCIPNGKVYGRNGTIITPDDVLLSDVSCEFGKGPGEQSFFNKNDIPVPKYEDKIVAVLASAGSSYFHWITGILPRLYLILKSGIDIKKIDYFLINRQLSIAEKESLQVLNIPLEKMRVIGKEEYVQAKNLIVPSLGWYKGSFPDWAVKFLRQQYLQVSPKNSPDKIYISREKVKGRDIINKQEVENFLRERNFKKVVLEDLSLNDQISIFVGARIIVAPHGAGLSNIVFSNPNTEVIEIFSPNYINPCYWSIINHLGIGYNCLLGETKGCLDNNSNQENIMVNLKELDKLMQSF